MISSPRAESSLICNIIVNVQGKSVELVLFSIKLNGILSTDQELQQEGKGKEKEKILRLCSSSQKHSWS